jgi:catalase (peroxidase I)
MEQQMKDPKYIKIKIKLDDQSKIAAAFGYAIVYLAHRDKGASMAMAEAACRVNGADVEFISDEK